MSTETVISMRELEAETAELLPSRETLNCWRSHGGSSYTSITAVGNDNGNHSFLPILNGSLDNNTVNILNFG